MLVFTVLFKVVQNFESVDDICNINYCDDSNELTIEQHFLVVLFIVLYKGKMFECVD